VLHRQHDDCGAGREAREPGDGIQARAAGHVQIQHQYVGPVGPDVTEDRLDVPGLGQDVELALCLEQHPQAAAHHRMVIRDHDPDLTLALR